MIIEYVEMSVPQLMNKYQEPTNILAMKYYTLLAPQPGVHL